jgi:hypothetical protein
MSDNINRLCGLLWASGKRLKVDVNGFLTISIFLVIFGGKFHLVKFI